MMRRSHDWGDSDHDGAPDCVCPDTYRNTIHDVFD